MAKPALASRLRQRVDLVRPTRTKLPGGGNETSTPAYATGVAAEVLALTGGEGVKERVLTGTRIYRITIRHRADVLQTDQLRYGTELLNIRSAVDPDQKRRELVIHADTDGVTRP